ncbi:hypothetical protein [Mycolicibacterium hippocampi]|uniref:hypothetical protein n=1 Tax=Mycolicibacterium hippocampi TaxID=659824 RepID=UPI0013D4C51A|nr:hypothetical protein [Mycolicibacterium hippocampi]
MATGAAAQRLGSSRVAALCLVIVAAALALLGLAGDSVIATAASACIFGVGYVRAVSSLLLNRSSRGAADGDGSAL